MRARLINALDPRRSLQARLTLAIAGISVLLSLLVSVLVGVTAERQARQDVGALHAEYAQRLADELDASIDSHEQNLDEIASLLAALPYGTPDSNDQTEILDKLQAAYPEYAWLGLVNRDGNVIAGTQHLLEGRDLSQTPWFTAGLARPFVGDAHESQLLSALLKPDASGAPARFLDVATPVKDSGGTVIAVLGGQISWRWVLDTQQKILAPLQLRRAIEPIIVARDGRVLLGPDNLFDTRLDLNAVAGVDNQGPAAPGDYQIARWADGNDYLTGYARGGEKTTVEPLGWTVLVREPIASAFAGAQELRQRVLLFGVGLGLFFAAIGAWLMRRLVEPLVQIAAAADQIRQTEFVEIPVFPGDDEVARVSRSLHTLVNTLETRVRDRTREVLRLSEENKQGLVNRERLRMARDLHDTLAHTLAGLVTEIHLLQKMAQINPSALQQELAVAENAARAGLADARAAIADLRANPVRDMGLAAALRGVARQFQERSGVRTAFETSGELPLLQDARCETAYRIVEEALRNVERHSGAAHATIALEADRQNGAIHTVLRVTDDGAGFDVRLPVDGHYGLRGMREQAEAIGATLVVRSDIGRGTTIQLGLN